ncbi:hypothetical protein [Sulfuriroseicoccus oceanibius]|uniref:SLA1 homology domain-containing protein n=1 Tax=Sulfuriroseicoccus oceanibius TaxID=2707525 RepID=A0A6B3L1B0_9BACT|nr:hypothetical protein [Sulfuriroseicoccus oceanibius]QQL43809.1 hypothetical protein G3M56_007850 [Sulfuriroseicoccus oceanibius]
MKKTIMLVAGCLAMLGMHAGYGLERDRTFTSADGTKTFDGYLVEYDSKRDAISVRKEGGRVIKVTLDKLSEADQEFVKENASALAASRDLRVRLEKYRDSSTIEKGEGTRSSTRVEGYNVSIENLGKEQIKYLDVRTTIFVRRAAEKGPDLIQREVDEQNIESLSGGRREKVKTKGVPVVRVLEAGDAGC